LFATTIEVGDAVGDGVDAFGFHGGFSNDDSAFDYSDQATDRRVASADLEKPVFFAPDAAVPSSISA
jgi:hypothetical protein